MHHVWKRKRSTLSHYASRTCKEFFHPPSVATRVPCMGMSLLKGKGRVLVRGLKGLSLKRRKAGRLAHPRFFARKRKQKSQRRGVLGVFVGGIHMR